MTNFILLFGCVLFGIALRASARMPPGGHQALNVFIINISLPALTLIHLHDIHISTTLLPMMAMPWVVFVTGAAVFGVVGWCLKLDRPSIGALMLTGGLGNTSFVGIPMLEALLGPQAIGYGVLIDQLGTYLVLSTLGIVLVGVITAERKSVRDIAMRVAAFPPFQALVLALCLRDVPYPPWLEEALRCLSATLAPLALVSVGLQLSFQGIATHAKALVTGLAFKLVAAPLLVLVLLRATEWTHELAGAATILEAAMAPQIGAAIVATQHRLNPPLVALMVGIGIPLSFITVPAWHAMVT